MSKSYKKFASGGICIGSNTQYYRDRNKNTRNKNKHIIRNTIARYDLDDIDGIEFIENKRNREYLLNKWIKFLYYKERDIKEHLRNFKRYKRK